MPRTGLPYSWNWCVGSNTTVDSTRPGYPWQSDQITAGRKLIPISFLNPSSTWATASPVVGPNVEAARANNLPIMFRYNNLFYDIDTFTEFQGGSYDPDSSGEHPWMIRWDSAGAAWDTVTTQLSPWSKLAAEYAYRLGKLFANCEIIQESISLYSSPPAIIIFENNEVGLDYSLGPDRREDSDVTFIRDILTNAVGTYDINIATNLVDTVDHLIENHFIRRLRQEFQRGWYEAIYAQSEIWAERSGWCQYEQQKGDLYRGMSLKSDNSGNIYTTYMDQMFNNMLTKMSPAYKYGITGSCYLSSLYGVDQIRIWSAISSDRWCRDMLEWERSNGPDKEGISTNLCWEASGITMPPTPHHWIGFTRVNLWIQQACNRSKWNLNGHFASSTQTVTGDEIHLYYHRVMDATDEVHSNATLSRFWRYGDLLLSIDPGCSIKEGNYAHPYDLRMYSYLQHVTENSRFDDALIVGTADEIRADLETRDRGATADNWKLSLSSATAVNVASFAVRLGSELLIFATGCTAEFTSITMRIPIDNALVDFAIPSAPVGGAFYTANDDGTGVTLLMTTGHTGDEWFQPSTTDNYLTPGGVDRYLRA